MADYTRTNCHKGGMPLHRRRQSDRHTVNDKHGHERYNRPPLNRFLRLQAAGCEIVRCGRIRYGMRAGDCTEIKNSYKRFLWWPTCILTTRLQSPQFKAGADKVRINPGNIGGRKEITRSGAGGDRTTDVPIRVGANAGSLPKDIYTKHV